MSRSSHRFLSSYTSSFHPEWGYRGGSYMVHTYKDSSAAGPSHTLFRKFSGEQFVPSPTTVSLYSFPRRRDEWLDDEKMNKFLTLILLAAYTAAGPTDVQPSQNLNCVEHDNAFFSCMFVKTISALNRATRSSNIEIIDGVTFVRDTPSKFLYLLHI